MKNLHLLMNEADGADATTTASTPAPEFKRLEDTMKKLEQGLAQLASKVTAPATPAPKKQVEDEADDLETMILVDPKKAVAKITSKVKEEVMSSVTSQGQAQAKFQEKFSELHGDYPEISDTRSDLHLRAKEILQLEGASQFDASALERAVLRAASEKGVLPVKHRKATERDDSDDGYLGAGNSGGDSRGSRRRSSSSEKLDPKTYAFAQLLGMDTSDPKVIERLTKTQNDRRGNWNKYK